MVSVAVQLISKQIRVNDQGNCAAEYSLLIYFDKLNFALVIYYGSSQHTS